MQEVNNAQKLISLVVIIIVLVKIQALCQGQGLTQEKEVKFM